MGAMAGWTLQHCQLLFPYRSARTTAWTKRNSKAQIANSGSVAVLVMFIASTSKQRRASPPWLPADYQDRSSVLCATRRWVLRIRGHARVPLHGKELHLIVETDDSLV